MIKLPILIILVLIIHFLSFKNYSIVPLGVESATDVSSIVNPDDTSLYRITAGALTDEITKTQVLQQQYNNLINTIQAFIYQLSLDTQAKFRTYQTQFTDAQNKATVLANQTRSALPDQQRSNIVQIKALNEIMTRINNNLQEIIIQRQQ